MLGLSLANSYATLRARQLQDLGCNSLRDKRIPFFLFNSMYDMLHYRKELSGKSFSNNETEPAAPLPPAGKCWSLSSCFISQSTGKKIKGIHKKEGGKVKAIVLTCPGDVLRPEQQPSARVDLQDESWVLCD